MPSLGIERKHLRRRQISFSREREKEGPVLARGCGRGGANRHDRVGI